MNFRSLLASLAVLGAMGAAPALAQQWGNLSGRFVYEGSAPKPAALQITKDIEVCGQHDLADESLVVGSDGGIQNVIVTLYSRGPVKVHPSYEETADAKVELDNHGCRFEPHVVLLRTSQTLVIGNKDPVGHNTKLDTISNPAINPIIPPNSEMEHTFQREERLPAVPVSCSIHTWMKAWVVVKSHPYMAVTDEHGNFKIENLPAGEELTFHVWQEKAGNIDQVKVGGKDARWQRGRVQVMIKPGENSLGEVHVAPAVFNK